MNKNWKTLFWAVLWAVYPPTLVMPMFYCLIKPPIKGEVPKGLAYFFWISALTLWIGLFQLPFGSVSNNIKEALAETNRSQLFIFAYIVGIFLNILMIVLALRNVPNRSTILPFKKFQFKPSLLFFIIISFSPFAYLMASNNSLHRLATHVEHPLIIAILNCKKAHDLVGVILGFIAVGVIGPIFEEMVFRGLLLEPTHDLQRSNKLRLFIDILISLFFASLHWPISFVFPFIFSMLTIRIRRQTQSIVPTILMHVIWNSSLTWVFLKGI